MERKEIITLTYSDLNTHTPKVTENNKPNSTKNEKIYIYKPNPHQLPPANALSNHHPHLPTASSFPPKNPLAVKFTTSAPSLASFPFPLSITSSSPASQAGNRGPSRPFGSPLSTKFAIAFCRARATVTLTSFLIARAVVESIRQVLGVVRRRDREDVIPCLWRVSRCE